MKLAKMLGDDDTKLPNIFVVLLLFAGALNKLPSEVFTDAKIFCCFDIVPKMLFDGCDDGLSLDDWKILFSGNAPLNADFPNRLSDIGGCTVPFSCSGFGSIFELNLLKILGFEVGDDLGDGAKGTLKTGSSSSSSSRNGV